MISTEYEMNTKHRRRNLESTILIWLTEKANETQREKLRNMIDYIQVFDNANDCHLYLDEINSDERVYILTSIPYSSNRAVVYVYQNDSDEKNFNEVVQQLEIAHNAQIDAFGLNIFSQSSHSSLNSQFLWFQRILSILLDSNDREMARQNFVDAYKRYFDGNQRKEEKIQEFELTYKSENAVRWYTRDCFFFEILNKALRMQDIDTLFS